jgi:arginyl-tRNA synthetase
LWQKFRDLSLREFQRVYTLLAMSLTATRERAFTTTCWTIPSTKLSEKGITRESQGALIVDLGEDMPPCLLRKKDGATLYVTRDIERRPVPHDNITNFAKALYVVGADQILHFKQLFKVLEADGPGMGPAASMCPLAWSVSKTGRCPPGRARWSCWKRSSIRRCSCPWISSGKKPIPGG